MSSLISRLRQFWQPSRAKHLFLASCALIWIGLGALFVLYGYQATWRLWGVTSLKPFFIDFRLLPAMVQSIRHGLDPTVANSADPLGRVFNYPSAWLLLRFTNLSQSDTLWAGITMLVLFFLGLVLFPGRLRRAGVILLLLIGFSPAAMLLYERANVDLLIFFLCALAIAAVSLSATVAAGILGVASVLKFYPFFGIVAFMSKGRRAFAAILVASTLLFAAYLALTYRDISRAWNTTNRGRDSSYGVQVVGMHFESQVRAILRPYGIRGGDLVRNRLKQVSYVGAGALALLFLWLGLKARPRWTSMDTRNLAAFWMGAAVYTGSFLLGNNWDYRLVFLLFALPQLAEWLPEQSRSRRAVAWTTTVLIVISCWYAFYRRYLLHAAAFVVDQTADWALFAALVYLLAASVPDSIRSLVGFRSEVPVQPLTEMPISSSDVPAS